MHRVRIYIYFKCFSYLSLYDVKSNRKLSEKLLSSAASANDVNEARCNPLVCEPKVNKFNINPQDYALVLMTDKVYQMFLETGIYLFESNY
jgi:hypothetical protein